MTGPAAALHVGHEVRVYSDDTAEGAAVDDAQHSLRVTGSATRPRCVQQQLLPAG